MSFVRNLEGQSQIATEYTVCGSSSSIYRYIPTGYTGIYCIYCIYPYTIYLLLYILYVPVTWLAEQSESYSADELYDEDVLQYYTHYILV